MKQTFDSEYHGPFCENGIQKSNKFIKIQIFYWTKQWIVMGTCCKLDADIKKNVQINTQHNLQFKHLFENLISIYENIKDFLCLKVSSVIDN